MRAEIEAADPDGPVRATVTAAAAIATYLSGASPDFKTRAVVVEATKQA